MRPAATATPAATPAPGGAARGLALAACGCVVVAASLLVAPGPAGWFGAGLGLLALAIADIDARAFLIPDRLNLALAALGFAAAAVAAPEAPGEAVLSAAIRGGTLLLVFLGLRAAYFWWRGREGVGLGDVKLAGVAGVWLDWGFSPLAVELAALAALLACAALHVSKRRRLESGTRLPFGAFFAPAIWAIFLAQSAFGGP